jgi:hypothetical protein
VPAIAGQGLPEAIGEDLVGPEQDGRAPAEIAGLRHLDGVLVPLERPQLAGALAHVDEHAPVAVLDAIGADLARQLPQRLQGEAPSTPCTRTADRCHSP